MSGKLGGRHFAQPKTRTVRPLSDKVRAAIFDVVGPATGLTVLDAYAGSGAAGFEAVSRGALLVEAIESNPRVAKTIQESTNELDLGFGYILHVMSVETWLASPQQQDNKPRYGLIIADPPYAKIEPDIIERLAEYLTPQGLMVLSHSSKIASPQLTSAELVKTKTYGDTTLTFYRRA
jgi:16S rRNA (guanine966-N2)-methyltransferase